MSSPTPDQLSAYGQKSEELLTKVLDLQNSPDWKEAKRDKDVVIYTRADPFIQLQTRFKSIWVIPTSIEKVVDRLKTIDTIDAQTPKDERHLIKGAKSAFFRQTTITNRRFSRTKWRFRRRSFRQGTTSCSGDFTQPIQESSSSWQRQLKAIFAQKEKRLWEASSLFSATLLSLMRKRETADWLSSLTLIRRERCRLPFIIWLCRIKDTPQAVLKRRF